VTEAQVIDEFAHYLKDSGVPKQRLKDEISYLSITKQRCDDWFNGWLSGFVQPLECTYAHILNFELALDIYITPSVVMSDVSELQAALSGWLVMIAPIIPSHLSEGHVVKGLRFNALKNNSGGSNLLIKVATGETSTSELGLFGLLAETIKGSRSGRLTVIDINMDNAAVSDLNIGTAIPLLLERIPSKTKGEMWLSYKRSDARAFEKIF